MGKHSDNPAVNQPPNWSIISWRVLAFTVPLEAGLLLLSLAAAYAAHGTWHMGFFADVLVFYGTLMALTILTLKLIRTLYPPVDGCFTQEQDPQTIYIWGLINFLSMTNLFLHYQCNLLPSPVRKFFSQLLGAKIGKGLVNIGGLIVDPYAITIEETALIGHEALLLPHMFTGGTLTRGRITVRRGAVVGARSILMPGVTVGEGAMVKAMSLVAEGTTIAPNEIWGGIPARKMGESPGRDRNAPVAFSSWRDMLISPLVEYIILGLSGYAAWTLAQLLGFGLFGGFLIFYGSMVGLTLLTLQVMRWIWPFREGRYSFKNDPWACYRWNLHGFLCIFNLSLNFQNGLLSPIVRRLFSQSLGAKLPGHYNYMPMSGLAQDPFMVTLNAGSIICNEVLILGHVLTPDELILLPVKIDVNAVVEQRSLIMPGVTVEQGARVEPLSLVTTGTHVRSGEIWRGVPARKIGQDASANPDAGQSVGFKINLLDMVMVASLRLGILGVNVLGLIWLLPLWWGDGFLFVVLFHLLDLITSVSVLWLFRKRFHFQPGTYTKKQHLGVIRYWGVYETILVSNLKFYYLNALLPPHLRIYFLQLLGLQTSNDYFAVGGLVLEPHVVKIGKHAITGLDSLISPIQLTQDSLVVGRIDIGDRVLIGPRAVILPNVVIGHDAVVQPMSLVLPGTQIAPFEIWSGIPAVKVGDVRRP